MSPLVEIRNLSKVYVRGKQKLEVLHHINLDIAQGDFLALMGPSGSGKTTLVNLIGCLDRPTNGIVRVNGEDISGFSRRQLTRFRAEHIGLVFQQFHLIAYLTALENVMLAQHFHSLADEGEAKAALDYVGLGDRVNHLPGQLSGGEQQRVSIARALINDPSIILADEPTGNLDEANEAIVLGLLQGAHRAGKTILMVTHDPAIVRHATRCLQLRHGRIEDSNATSLISIPARSDAAVK